MNSGMDFGHLNGYDLLGTSRIFEYGSFGPFT